jgi:NitT/TauT family transport system substrate-binding protein
MSISRRDALRTIGGAGLLPMLPRAARAQGRRPIGMNFLGFCLGIHVPTTAAMLDLLPEQGYVPEMKRIEQIRTVVQSVISGATEMGEGDPIVAMSAVESGADVKVVGLWYMNTSLVFLANADKVRELKDLADPRNVIAVNQKGDITHVMLVGPLLKRGVDIDKLNIVEIGGSGGRMRALLSGRVHAVPVHFDQAAEVMKQGNYKILFEPWKEYRAWINEVWVVKSSWLKDKKNERAVIDVLKATMTGFAKAQDFAWYADAYRKHATLKEAKTATDDVIRPLWEGLKNEVGAWPMKTGLNLEDFRELLPVYKQADAIQGTAKLEDVMEPSLAQQAISELG